MAKGPGLAECGEEKAYGAPNSILPVPLRGVPKNTEQDFNEVHGQRKIGGVHE